MATYLVAGAAGFTGSSIAQALIDRGDNMRGIDNFSTDKQKNLIGLEKMEFME